MVIEYETVYISEMFIKMSDKLSPLYSEILNKQRYEQDGRTDVTFKIKGEDGTEVTLRAHKVILSGVSPAFQTMFDESSELR